jgi:DNA-binding beta-propeller fold protein YncE
MLLVVCLAALLVPATASAEYTFLTKWGNGGSGDGQFRAPYGVVADTSGHVYVTDFGNGLGNNDRVEKFDSNGTFLTKWGSLGPGDTEFHDPWGIATDSGGNVYVADVNNHYIKKFDSSGVFITKFGGGGTGDGQFGFPFGVAVDAAGNVYVADHSGGVPKTDRVQKFKPTLGGYAYDDQWGVTGPEPGQFKEPADVATDSSGNVYVSDRNNHRIQKFDSEGFFLTAWGSMGSGDGQLAFPEGIATDSAGNVYVADRGNNRVQKFSSNGAFITKFGSTGAGDGQFLQPNDVTVDAAGNVYVADTGNDRIQKFAETGAALTDGGGVGGSGGGRGGGVVIDVSNQFTIENTTVLSKNGALKFKLKLPAPGQVEATATVIPPPRPPSLDPGHREHEGHKSQLAKTVTMAMGSATANAAGPLSLTLSLNKKGKKFLGWKSPLKATVEITYTPTGGTAGSITRSVKFKLAKKNRFRR